MNRYVSSFLITSVLAVIVGILGYLVASGSYVKPKPKKEKIVKIRMEKPKEMPKLEPKKQPVVEPKQIPVPQPQPEPIVTPKPEPVKETTKPTPKTEPVKETPKPTPKTEPVKETTKPTLKTEPVKETPKPTPKTEPVKESSSNDGEMKGFIKGLKSSINAKKKYPNEAIREHIQGSVHMVFNIESDGSASNIRVTGGDVLLRNAAKKSLLDSCPIRIPSSISGSFPIKDVSTDIVFKLE